MADENSSDMTTPLIEAVVLHGGTKEKAAVGTSVSWKRFRCSIGFNILFILIICLMIPQLFSFKQASKPEHHHRKPNSTTYSCPFDDDESIVPNRLHSNKKILAVAQISSDFAAFCWRNIEQDERGNSLAPYSIYLKDPWTQVEQEYIPVYNGRGLTFNLTDLLPSTEYSVRLENVKVVSGKSSAKLLDQVSFTTKATESCGNEADVQKMRVHRSTLKFDVQKCLISNIFNENKAAECVRDHTDLSVECSHCFIVQGKCSLDKCATHCLLPSSDACKKCSEALCFGALVDCSGLPRWAFPP